MWPENTSKSSITGAVGLAAATDWVQGLGWGAIAAHERALLEWAQKELSHISGLRIYGTATGSIGVVSFIVDAEGVAIRADRHRATPLMQRYGVAAMARASLGVYNTEDDVHALVRAVRRNHAMFAA